MKRVELWGMTNEKENTEPCKHESELTPDGNGAFCKHCGETLE